MSKPVDELQLDLRSPDVLANPVDAFAQMRATCPVFHDPDTDSYYLTKLEDVKSAAIQPNVFSSHRPVFGAGDPELEAIAARGYRTVATLTTNDPPVHTRYRKLVNRAFAPKAVKALEPAIGAIVDELIDRFVDRGEVDFVSEFSCLVPGYVIADALGVAREDQQLFMKWADDIVATIIYPYGLTREQQIECAESFVAFQQYFVKEIEKRRANPDGTDMLSDLVFAEVAGERPLDLEELLEMARTLLVAGNETTASWIENTMLLLVDHPDVLARVSADHSLIPAMLEETLRLTSPSRWVMRTVESPDASAGGTHIPEGCRVRLVWNSANRDEDRFADPDVFDIDRASNDHVAFGHGVHYCIGANLARAEARIAFEAILGRLGDIELAVPRDQVGNLPVAGVNRINRLPLRFTAR